MRIKVKSIVPYLMFVFFSLALWSVYRQLHGYRWHDLVIQIRQIPTFQVGLALLLTLAGYLVMTAYDFLALKYIDHPLPYAKTALASGLGYAFSNNVGFSMLAGASIRYRIYTAWGLSAMEITQVVLFCSVSLWLGFAGLSGIIFVIQPMALPHGLHLPFTTVRPIGIFLLIILVGYGAISFFGKRYSSIKEWRFSLPSWPIAVSQLAVAAADWFLAGMVLFVLWPRPITLTLGHFLAMFMLAQLGGLISQVPGGLGVFESIIALLAPPSVGTPQLLGTLIVYRGLYYLLPLGVATIVLGIEEALRRKKLFSRARDAFTRAWTGLFVPLLSLTVFFTGAILLFSGSLPAISDRLHFLEGIIPLPVLETSHFVGSLVGMALLLLAWGLQQRLDAAYVLTLIALCLGMVASLLKGLDFEEATILALIFLALLPNRPLFFRRASLFSERFSAGWTAAIAIIIIAAIWLGMFAFRHIGYAHDLWWHFSLEGDAPRFMRASVGVVTLALGFGMARLLRPAPPKPHTPGSDEMAVVQAIVNQSTSASANLALLGDKYFLINAASNAFIMYGVSGQSWISMGDPVGPEAEWSELIWQFHHNAKRYSDHTVFYEVAHTNLHLYLDLGLVALKLGEEARVPLAEFSLEGKDRKNMRNTQNRLVKQGCTFELVPEGEVEALLPALKSISDRWVAEKNTREKGFSLGFFNADYLRRTPVAIVRLDGRPVAFANVWQSAGQQEVTIDLMRHLLDYYLGTWQKERVMLIGYSLGADVLPFMASRLPEELRTRVDLIALLAPAHQTSFEFHLSDWLGKRNDDQYPTRPEVEKLDDLPLLCFYGKKEKDSLCRDRLPQNVTIIPMAGAHHFGGDYNAIVMRILHAVK